MRSLSVVTGGPAWRRAAMLGAANAVQIVLPWWTLRGAATATRPRSTRVRVLQGAALLVANALQTSLTWWLSRGVRGRHWHVPDAAAQQPDG
jgi:hypothetical protein